LKGKRIKLAVIIGIILFSLWRVTPTARADGAIPAEDVWVEWTLSTNLGMTTTNGSGYNLEDDSWLNVFNVTGSPVDVNYTNLIIYYMQGYIHSDDNDNREVRAYAYNWTANNDAGEQYGESVETWPEAPAGAYSWKGGTLTTPISVGDVRIFFYGLWADSEGGSYTLAQPTSGGYYIFRNTVPDDPFTEGASGSNALSIRFRARGEFTTTTDYNLYVGNGTHYTARRDINYTFPAGAVNEEITMSFNTSEAIQNVTRYNGGAWGQTLDPTEYSTGTLNGTHNVLTIPEATINSYGGLYRVYTNSYSYYYEVGGAFYENGTSYGAVNITAETTGGTVTYEVDGTTGIGSNDEIISFQWDVGDAYRFIYPRAAHENFNIFFPDDNYATYEFELRDFTGELYTGPTSYIESYRYVNGSEAMIERILIQDVVNEIPLTLVQYQTYTLTVILPDGSSVEFGLFVAGALANPVLALTEISFSSRAQITYQYVTVESTRVTSTQITVNYNDTLTDTDEVTILIEYRNGTDIYTDTSFEDSVQWNWASADQYTDYVINVEITHGIFGEMSYREIIGVSRPFNPFPSLEAIGTFGPIEPGNLLSIFIVAVCALAFSYLSAEVGGFVAVAVAGILRYWGVNDFDYTTLAIAGSIVIMYALMRRSTK
jgi:hypothetical protein